MEQIYGLSICMRRKHMHKVVSFGLLLFHRLPHYYLSIFFQKLFIAAAKSLQSCPTLSDPMDCGLPGSSIHGIFQAKVLERGAIAFYLLRTYHMPGTIQCIQYTAERKTNVEKKSCPHGVYTSGVELRGKQRVKKPGR